MAKGNRLPEIEVAAGEPLTRLIPRLLNEHGNVKDVAEELDVHPNTISRWMKKAGVRRVVVVKYELPEASHAPN